MHKVLVLIPKHTGDFTKKNFWDISLKIKFNHSVLNGSDGGSPHRQFMIYWDYKKIVGGFLPLLAGCFHTQLCSNTFIKVIFA